MRFVLQWSRLDLRRRWVSLVALTILIALGAGTVLTAVSAGRRTSSAAERSAAEYLPATANVFVLSSVPLDWAKVRALPEVLAVAPFTDGDFEILDPLVRPPAAAQAEGDAEAVDDEEVETAVLTQHSAEAMHTIKRPVVLQGRLPDPSATDEVVVTPMFLDAYGKELGDPIQVRFFTPKQTDNLWDPEFLDDIADPRGPEAALRVVGVVRAVDDVYTYDEPLGSVVAGPGLHGRYRDNILGRRGFVAVSGDVRLRGGEATLPAFTAGLRGLLGEDESAVEVFNVAASERRNQDLTELDAGLLLAFAAIAGAAGVVMIGIWVSRHARQVTAAQSMLRGAGLSGRASAACAAAGPAVAALVGATTGAGASVIVSRWTPPFGAAAAYEREPGRLMDWPVLAGGTAAIVALVVGWALVAGWIGARAGQGRRTPRRRLGAPAGVGLSVAAAVGWRFALHKRPGSGSAAATIIVVAFGVGGVVAASCILVGNSDFQREPARFGTIHQIDVELGFEGADFVPPGRAARAVAALPSVSGLNDLRRSVATTTSGAAPLSVATLSAVGDWPVVLAAGRLPKRPGEIAMGVRSARDLNVELGATTRLTGSTAQPVEVTLVGVGFLDIGDFWDSGALVVPGTFDQLFESYQQRLLHVALRPGVDVGEGERAIRAAVATLSDGEDFVSQFFMPNYGELEGARLVSLVTGGFLLVMALGTLGYALVSSVRSRAGDVAVLRALGMTRRQTRGVTRMQATLFAIIGAAVGIPLGFLLGRALWRVFATRFPFDYHAPTPVWALVLALPASVLIANLLAAWPARKAGRLQPVQALRAE